MEEYKKVENLRLSRKYIWKFIWGFFLGFVISAMITIGTQDHHWILVIGSILIIVEYILNIKNKYGKL